MGKGLAEVDSNVLHEFVESKFLNIILLPTKACILRSISFIGTGKEVLHNEALLTVSFCLFFTGTKYVNQSAG